MFRGIGGDLEKNLVDFWAYFGGNIASNSRSYSVLKLKDFFLSFRWSERC